MKTKAKTVAAESAPTIVNGKVPPPRRLPNAERRQREYLTGEEVDRLIDAARSRLGRHGHRDATMILLAYRHGLRASELVALRWDMIDYHQGYLHVRRLKNGRPSVHTLRGSELRALRRLENKQAPPSPYVFTTERRTPMTAAAFRKQLSTIGKAAELPFPVHPLDFLPGCGGFVNEPDHPRRARWRRSGPGGGSPPSSRPRRSNACSRAARG